MINVANISMRAICSTVFGRIQDRSPMLFLLSKQNERVQNESVYCTLNHPNTHTKNIGTKMVCSKHYSVYSFSQGNHGWRGFKKLSVPQVKISEKNKRSCV